MTASVRFLFFLSVLAILGCNASVEESASTSDGTSNVVDKVDIPKADNLTSPIYPREERAGDPSSPVLAMSVPAPPVAGSPWSDPVPLSDPALDSETTATSEVALNATGPVEPVDLTPSGDPASDSVVPMNTAQTETEPSMSTEPRRFLSTPPVDSSGEKVTLWNGTDTFPEPGDPQEASSPLLTRGQAPPLTQGQTPSEMDGLLPVEPGTASLAVVPAAASDRAEPNVSLNPLRNSDVSETNELRVDGLRGEAISSISIGSASVGGSSTAKGRPNSKGQPFDPIKENGLFFMDWPKPDCPVPWPKPDLVLVMTGRQNGYIEPCGCAGMERMVGGLTRRASLLKDLVEKRKWPVVAVDLGNQVKGHKRQTELKFQHTTETLLEMKYSAIGLGIADLQLPAGELAAITSNENSPFVSANIDLLQADSELIEKMQLVERDGIKIGITAVLGNSFRKQINNKSILTSDPVAAIEKMGDSLKKCEVRILLAYADAKESEALAKKFPMFNIVVTAAGGSEPPKKVTVIPGTKTYLVQVGEKGACAVVLGIYRDKNCPVRYQRVMLDSRYPQSEKIARLMSLYQDQLKTEGFEGLRIKPVPCPEAELKGAYIGSKKCATCHEASYDVWRKSKHAKAWKTLVDAKPPRNHDPECISCHVVGWDPQNHYPFVGGFISPKKTPELENVGCESCHGPGGAHAKAEEGADIKLQERLQKAMVVTVEESRSDPKKMCYNCHDLDNSPEFNFDKYWPEVAHKEDEDEE